MALLEVKALQKTFEKTQVLRDISFEVERGQVLAIIGSSGSGKTTLLRCLNFLEQADSGSITVNGEALFGGKEKNNASEAELRKKRLHFGLVFQNFNLFPQYNVLRNVTLAPSMMYRDIPAQQLEQSARELLAMVGLSDKVEFFPCQLSGGQQQRVAIARALAMKPDILCFDEPTSALDPELTGEVLRVIRSLKDKERTMIIVTHEMEFARNVADRVIFMADGVIEEQGTPQEVFDAPKSEKTRAFLQKMPDSI